MNKVINFTFKKFCICAFIIVVNFLSINSAFAANQENSQDALIKHLNKMPNFESQYEQSVFDNNNRLIETSRGKFYFANNLKSHSNAKSAFKNSIEYPEKSLMVSDGIKLWMIDYELEQVIVSNLKDYLDASPISLLLGDTHKILETFSIEKSENAALNQSLYRLKAKDTMASISNVRLGFKHTQISYIELDERSGNKVRINFSNSSELKNPQGAFKVSLPKDFEIIDETLQEIPDITPP